ncbi:MAG: Ig-like domain-containing protein [Acidimicrobiales bacterium]
MGHPTAAVPAYRRRVSRRARLTVASLLAIALQMVVPATAAWASACSTTDLTVTRISGGELDIDTGINPQLTGGYAGYAITTSNAAVADLWVRAANFAGGTIGLAPHEDGLVHVGPLTTASPQYAYIYLAAAASSTGQTHDIQLYEGHPNLGGTQLCSDSFSLISDETIKASANKVDSVVSGPNPAEVGGIVTITVTGDTGLVGDGPGTHPDGLGSFKGNPATDAAWPADAYQLVDASITFDTSGTFDHTLVVTGLNSTSQQYTATYTFVAVGTTATPTSVTPVNYIASGTQIKHTDTGGFSSLDPLLPPESSLTMGKVPTPASLAASGGTVTYTVTTSNDGNVDVTLDDITDVLPAGATYVNGSATFNSVAIADPTISGQTLSFVGVFPVAHGGSSDLVYQATLPGVVANYTNTVVAHIAGSQVDSTLSLTDDVPATAQVSVGDPNDPPVAVDDSATTAFDTPATVNVATNDTDADGNGDIDLTSITITAQPSHGTATPNTDGTVTYTPTTGYSGTDTFTYQICDNANACDTAVATITINGPTNHTPVAVDDSATTAHNTAVAIDVVDNDTDADGNLADTTVTITSQPGHGTVTVAPNGIVTYTPANGYSGTDTFTYQVCDSANACDTAVVTITVGAPNDPPVYNGQRTYTVAAGGTVPSLGYTDPDGNAYTVSLLSGALPPGLTLNTNGTWSGTAPSSGSYSFTVQACDNATPPACTTTPVTLVFGRLAETGPEHLRWFVTTGFGR